MIPYGRQEITAADIEAVTAALRSDWLTQGPAVPAFERAVAEYCGAPHAVAVNSATSALHLACLALGVGPGDRVWTSPITFVASANCALYCGAEVDFVDIDPLTCNLSAEELERKLRDARAAKRLPKVVLPVHFAGEPCDMQAIAELAREYGFAVIEDASHAIGAHYRGEPVGNCRHSDITVFSFHPVKIVTTGEGGMALSRRAELADRMALLRSHGITRDQQSMGREPDGRWYYEQQALGFNYRMTDIQAALGSSQMNRLDEYIAARQRLAARYDRLLADLPLDLPVRDPRNRSALHLYPVRLKNSARGLSRRRVFDGMLARGIGVNVHYIPVHTQPYYRQRVSGAAAFPEAERYYDRAISLPLYPTLSDVQQDTVIAALRESIAA